MTGVPLLERTSLPAAGTTVDLAVSGGPDSVGLTLLAAERGLDAHLHHVRHHLRPDDHLDAELVRELGRDLGFPVTVYDVAVDHARGLEAGARAARRAALPPGALTAHTMDDLAETMLLNVVWGAGLEGLSPHVRTDTAPLLDIRRAELRAYVEASGRPFILDPTNDDRTRRRNAVRHEVMSLLGQVGERDVVPLLARSARLIADELAWLDEATAADRELRLTEADCRELAQWPVARLRRWLRRELVVEESDGTHPPSAADVERAVSVVRGEATACELAGGRRLSRTQQRLRLS